MKCVCNALSKIIYVLEYKICTSARYFNGQATCTGVWTTMAVRDCHLSTRNECWWKLSVPRWLSVRGHLMRIPLT